MSDCQNQIHGLFGKLHRMRQMFFYMFVIIVVKVIQAVLNNDL